MSLKIGSAGENQPKKSEVAKSDTTRKQPKSVFEEYKQQKMQEFEVYKSKVQNDFDLYKKGGILPENKPDSGKIYKAQINEPIIIDQPPVYKIPENQKANQDISNEMRNPENWKSADLQGPQKMDPMDTTTMSKSEQNKVDIVNDKFDEDIKPFSKEQILKIDNKSLLKRAELAPTYDLQDGSIEVAGINGFVESVVRREVTKKGQQMQEMHNIYMFLIDKENNGTPLNNEEKEFMLDFEISIAQFYKDTEKPE